MDDSVLNLLTRAAALQRHGRSCTICLVVKTRGSTPQGAGAMMLVADDSATFGTIGGGCIEAEVRRRAMARLSEGRSELMSFKLDQDYGWDDGLICGGSIEVVMTAPPAPCQLERILETAGRRASSSLDFEVEASGVERRFRLNLPVRDRLYIAGAGHVGLALARMAKRLDFDVTVFDDRPDLVAPFQREGVSIVCGDIADTIAAAPFDAFTWGVVVTRGHRNDAEALKAMLGRGARYLGMIGSRRKVKLIVDSLRESGSDPEELARLHAPIGLEIGAVTVEEIAISIAGQLIETRRRSGQRLVEEVSQPERVTAG